MQYTAGIFVKWHVSIDESNTIVLLSPIGMIILCTILSSFSIKGTYSLTTLKNIHWPSRTLRNCLISEVTQNLFD